ncbi:methylated-DNA-protein-cysteine methyltransferase [Grosmannia clavigera kw1407]|uniref:Methylated-DNA--protein-cysteine methyltransferase n=1 Tax=Grosmannia clavigera (strain kw1407 / UAMH 11150) TaxID=655863 RepID=F0XA69_GROCL|nr:methylated-DNA-protein-cysteine methyltransferase [Grosmannia clavigera kw1407]EFX05637.1 methylated-DNA-protein-cysteine methyltransferase [Grosmannia clavigera kw1407]
MLASTKTTDMVDSVGLTTTATAAPITTVVLATTPSPRDRTLKQIAASGRSAFEQRVWSLLCQIPTGQVTTYGIMAAYLGSSPRAVGNAMRRNLFAPMVPCHRCIATGGGLGGFKGVGPERKRGQKVGSKQQAVKEGITLAEKRSLLRMEGVRFDSKGRVLGTPFQAFRETGR